MRTVVSAITPVGSASQIAVIGAIIGILSVLLGLLSPELFSWYSLSLPSIDGGFYLTGFGNSNV